MARKAYSYIRFSTPEQAKGTSLGRQGGDAREYAKKQGWDLDESLRDLGVSAFRGANRVKGALSRFLKLVEDGTVPQGSILIVESLDRLSREQVLTAFTLFGSILESGVEIVTLIDKKHYTSESVNSSLGDLMMSIVIMAQAHEESAKKAERLAKAWKIKREKIGERKLTGRCPAWLELSPDRKSFRPIEERVQVLRRIFTDTAAGIGAATIAANLNREGVEPWGEGKQKADGWQASYIKKLLSGDAVLGTYQPHVKNAGKRTPVGDPISDYYPQVIDDALYYLAKRAREGRRLGGGRRGKSFSNVLTGGIARCGECGRSMQFVDKGALPKGGQYLVCSGGLRGMCQHRTHHAYPQIEATVLRGIVELDFSRITDDNADDEIRTCRDRITALDGRISDAQRRRRNLLEAFADDPDPDTKDLIARFAAEIEEAKAGLRKEKRILKELENGIHDLSKHVGEIERLCQMMKDAGDEERYRIRAAVNQELKNVLRGITFSPDRSWIVQLQKSLKHYAVVGGRFLPLEEDFLFSALAALDEPDPRMSFGD